MHRDRDALSLSSRGRGEDIVIVIVMYCHRVVGGEGGRHRDPDVVGA